MRIADSFARRVVASLLAATLLLCGCPQGPALSRGPFSVAIDLITPFNNADTARLQSLAVSPISVELTAIGQTVQLAVTGVNRGGQFLDLSRGSSGTTYASADDTVATVTGDGLVTATGVGSTTVNVANAGRSAQIAVSVKVPAKPIERLESIRVSPQTLRFGAPGQSRQLEVQGTFSSGRVADLTAGSSGTTYAVSDSGIATVTADGLAAAIAAGETSITVQNADQSATISVFVDSLPVPLLTALRVSPAVLTLTTAGATQSLRVFGTYSDGAERDLTTDAATSFESDAASIASVSSAGVVTAHRSGVATISGRHGAFVASVPVTVAIPAPGLNELRVRPAAIEFTAVAQRVQLEVEGIFADGSVRELTDSANGTVYSLDDVRTASVAAFGEVSPIASGATVLHVANGAVSTSVPINVRYCLPRAPIVDPVTPRVRTPSTAVSGLCDPGCTVEIDGPGGRVNVLSGNGAFTADVPLATNLVNALFVTAIAPCGARSAPVTVFVTHDATPPTIRIDFPINGAQLSANTVAVSGRVSDVLSGYEGLQVTVNGQSASVHVGIGTNGTFFLPELPLPESGELVITAVASDGLANAGSDSIRVTREAIPTGVAQMRIVAGDGQSGAPLAWLPQPLRVMVLRPDGVTPLAGKIVTWEITRSDGRLGAGPSGDGAPLYQSRTDSQGIAEAYWRVGVDAGQGNNRLRVVSTDIAGSIFFCASALVGQPSQINIGTGNFQRVEIGSVAAKPLRVWVSDGRNGVHNVPVEFRLSDGLVNGAVTATVLTDESGHADVHCTAGAEPGIQFVTATFAGNRTGDAVFTLYNVRRDLDTPTRFIGEVRDNSSSALGGTQLRLVIAGAEVGTAVTGADGDFEIVSSIPNTGGLADLYVDASAIDSINGAPVPSGVRFPNMHYQLPVVPNSVNRWMSEILLPRLQSENDRVFFGGQSQDLELPCNGIDGLKFIIKAGTTVTLANGTVIGPNDPGQVTFAVNQVHNDEIPMPMPDGIAPPFAWTFQPGGTRFDPPVQIEVPNMVGLAVGSIVDFLSFDHDTNRFEIVATGQVGVDGLVRSDPRSGIALSGWGGIAQPPTITGSVGKCGFTLSGPSTVRVGTRVTYRIRRAFDGGSISWTGGRAEGTSNETTYETVFTEPGEDVVGVSTCGQSKFKNVTVLPDCDVEITEIFPAGGGGSCPGNEIVFRAQPDCRDRPGHLDWSAPDGVPSSGVGPEFRTTFATPGIKDFTVRFIRDDGIAAASLSDYWPITNNLSGATVTPGTSVAPTIVRTCFDKPVVLTPTFSCGAVESDAVIHWSCPTATPSTWTGTDYPVVFEYEGLNLVDVTYEPAGEDPQTITLEVRIGECGGTLDGHQRSVGGLSCEYRCEGQFRIEMLEREVPIRTISWFLPEGGGSPAPFEGLVWEPQFCSAGVYPAIATITDECDNVCEENFEIEVLEKDVCPICTVYPVFNDQMGVARPGEFVVLIAPQNGIGSPCPFTHSPSIDAPGATIDSVVYTSGGAYLVQLQYCDPGDYTVRITYDVTNCGTAPCMIETIIPVTERELCNAPHIVTQGAEVGGFRALFLYGVEGDAPTAAESGEWIITPETRWRPLGEFNQIGQVVQFCEPGTYDVSGRFVSSCGEECFAPPTEIVITRRELADIHDISYREEPPGSGNYLFFAAAFPAGTIRWEVCGGGPVVESRTGVEVALFLDPSRPQHFVNATLTTDYCENQFTAGVLVPPCSGGFLHIENRAVNVSDARYTFGVDVPGLPNLRWTVYDDTNSPAANARPNTGTGTEFTTQFCVGGNYRVGVVLTDPPCVSDCGDSITLHDVSPPVCQFGGPIEQQTISQTVEFTTVRFMLPVGTSFGTVQWFANTVPIGSSPDVTSPFEYTFLRGCDDVTVTAVITTPCGTQCDRAVQVPTGRCRVGHIAYEELSRDDSDITYRFTLPEAVGIGNVTWWIGDVIVAQAVPVLQPFDYAVGIRCGPVNVRAELYVAGCDQSCSNTTPDPNMPFTITPCPIGTITATLDHDNLRLSTNLCSGTPGQITWTITDARAEPAGGTSSTAPGSAFVTELCEVGVYTITAVGPGGCRAERTFELTTAAVLCDVAGADINDREDPEFETPTTRRFRIAFDTAPASNGSVQWYIDGALVASLPGIIDTFDIDLNKGRTYSVRAVLTTPCGAMCDVNGTIVVQP